MYIQRTIEKTIQQASQNFRVVLLTGPRQVGKTTVLEHIEESNRSYYSFDDLNLRISTEEDPANFVSRIKLPTLLDEVQYVPSLFPYIKIAVDKNKEPGQFWLTGSQQFEMMSSVSESLAGRVAVLKLQGVSLAEEQGRIDNQPFLPVRELLVSRENEAGQLSMVEIYHKIWRGSYPDVVVSDGKNWEQFYESYVTTYIQKDIRDTLKIDSHATFYKFMQVAAARTGQLLNYKEISRDLGVSEPTIKSWLNVLQASGVIYLLQPYFSNQTKRLIKTPKLYFMDTGLCCFLTGWLNADVLERGAMAGAMLETFVISEIIKSYLNCGKTPRIYFYRDKDLKEIDLLVEENGTLYPIEIKKTATIKNFNKNQFAVLDKLKTPVGQGAYLCFTESLLPISKKIDAVPISYI